ncbi:hypothetical protein [Candidatus Portiera aleyrodidarum]|nr:hypothetical protein [Candidatus Portiera aleyrodidarum]
MSYEVQIGIYLHKELDINKLHVERIKVKDNKIIVVPILCACLSMMMNIQ